MLPIPWYIHTNTMVHTRCTDQRTPELTGACTLCLLVSSLYNGTELLSILRRTGLSPAAGASNFASTSVPREGECASLGLPVTVILCTQGRQYKPQGCKTAESEATSDACQNMTVPVPALVKHSPNIL